MAIPVLSSKPFILCQRLPLKKGGRFGRHTHKHSINMTKKLFILLVITMLGSCVVVFLSYTSFQGQAQNGVTGNVFQRVMSNDPIIITTSLQIDFDAENVRFYDGKFYIYNRQACKIIVMDSTGRQYTSIGRRGSGPEEFTLIENFIVDDSGLHAFDIRQQIFIRTDLEGKVFETHKSNEYILRSIKLNKAQFLTKTSQLASAKERECFQIVDISSHQTQNISAFRLPSENQNDSRTRDLHIEGFFVPVHNNNNRCFRVSYRAGQFVGFDTSGRYLYTRRTIDASPLPNFNISSKSDGSISISANGRIVNIAAFADQEYLYINSNAQSPYIKQVLGDTNDDRILDVYKNDTGHYQCSYILPKYKGLRANLLSAMGNGKFCAVYGGNIIALCSLVRVTRNHM